MKEPEKVRIHKEKITEVSPKEQEIRDNEQEWNEMKENITQIAKEVLETMKISCGKIKSSPCWTDEVRDAGKKGESSI